MSYRHHHIKHKINKIKPKKKFYARPVFWIAVFIISISSGIFYLLFFYQGLQVKNIEISGNQNISPQNLRDSINLSLKYKNILLADAGKLESDLIKNFPEAGSVKISKKLPQTLSVEISERKAVGAYCLGLKCFLIDISGVVFGSPQDAPLNLAIIRQFGQNAEIAAGDNAVAENIIRAIYRIEKMLKENFQIDLKEAMIASPSKLDIKTAENWQAYFDLSPGADINSQALKLGWLLEREIPSAGRKNLRYIDLRPKDRAIVCDNRVCEDYK